MQKNKFLEATKLLKIFNLLQILSKKPATSQHQLAKKIGVSSSMVNNYIKELYRKGLLVVKGDTNRNMRYELTPLGCERRDRLL
ncbi:MAG: winged helix-turn-helix transcriptional regulator, partial [Pseudomonadota bacterium]